MTNSGTADKEVHPVSMVQGSLQTERWIAGSLVLIVAAQRALAATTLEKKKNKQRNLTSE